MILLDSNDIKASCLNVHDNQLPAEMVAELRQQVMPVYIDRDTGLEEDMYTIDDIKDEFTEQSLIKWNDIIDELGLLMDKHECGYFRIIKTKTQCTTG